jgi:photosystem II stability/assembly factor-like uncharacterized protein
MKKIKAIVIPLFFLAIITVSLTKSLFAQGTASGWQFAGWYGGGCYPNVEFDPRVPGRVYLTSDVAGVWRSDDLGENWTFINEGLNHLNVASIAISPSNSEVLYAATKKGLCYSKNGGRNWTLCETLDGRISFERPRNYRSVAVSKLNPAVVAVGTHAGDLFYSSDFGAHWEVLGSKEKPFDNGEPITALELSSKDDYLFAASNAGMTRYSFHERTWTFIEKSPKGITDFHIQEMPSGPPTIYTAGQAAMGASYDGGETWSLSTPVLNGAIYRLAVSEVNGKTRFVAAWNKGWRGGVVVSHDQGLSWENLDGQAIPDIASNPTRRWASSRGKIGSLKINPFNPDILLRTDGWGVWRTDDSGLVWKEKIKGAPNTIGSDICISENGNIYVATMDNGLLKSADEGKSYRAIFPSKGYRKEVNGHVWRVIAPNNRKIFATSSPWNENINQVIRSADGGKSFDIVREGLPGKRPSKNTMWGKGYPRGFTYDPKAIHKMYLGIDGDNGGGFFISKDGGETWNQPGAQPGSRRIYNALAVDPSFPRRIYWGAYGKKGGVYRSDDEGLSWNHIFRKMRKVFDLAVAPDGTVYAAGDFNGPSLYVSEDHGENWRLLRKFSKKGTCDAIIIHPNDPNQIYIGVIRWDGYPGGEIYASKNKGRDWTRLTENLPPAVGPAAMAIHPVTNELYVVLHSGNVYKRSLESSKELLT